MIAQCFLTVRVLVGHYPSLMWTFHVRQGPNIFSVAYVLAIAVYVTVTIPALRTIVTPVVDIDTRDDQIEAMRVLSAGNTIMVVLLGAVLVLQVRITPSKRSRHLISSLSLVGTTGGRRIC